MNYNNNQYGKIILKVQEDHTYLSGSQQLPNCTSSPFNKRKIMPGSSSLPNYLGLAKPWRLEENLISPMYQTSVILTS